MVFQQKSIKTDKDSENSEFKQEICRKNSDGK